MMMPHCDSSVLHAPEVCEYCDKYPNWQEYRILSRINFTNETDPDKAPCPSTHFRPAEIVNRWGGNRAEMPEKVVMKTYRDLRKKIAKGELF